MQEISNLSLFYPIFMTFLLTLSLILVNRKKYQYLFFHGLLGAIISSLILIINIHLIKAWNYVETGGYSVLGVPIFILVAWIAAIILFLWGLPETKFKWVHYLYIGLFALIGAGIDNIFHDLGLRSYADWYRVWMWFFVLYLNFWISYKIYFLREKYLD
ncbi:MAG: hypothetical protein ACOC1O_03220 [bacterium]